MLAPSLSRNRARVLRDSLGVGVATGAYGLSFGALAVAGGFSIPEACVLSLLMFTGGSQFALVSTVTNGGSGAAGAATAVLLGSRNALYGLEPVVAAARARRASRAATAQLVIDESTAMAVGQDNERDARLGFYATGLAVFVLWNLATLIGAFGARAIDDPATTVSMQPPSAAFVALLAPRMTSRACVDRRGRGDGRRARAHAARHAGGAGAVCRAGRGGRRLAGAR